MEYIDKIDKRLDYFIENQIMEIRDKRDNYERNIKNIKHDNKLNVINLLRRDDIFCLSILSQYKNYMYDVVNELVKIVFPKWENDITELPKDEDRKILDLTNTPFLLFVHAIGCKLETAIENLKTCNIIATSMVTNNSCNLYGNRKFGFIYSPNKDNIILINSGDCHADELPVDNNYPGIFAEYLSADTYLKHSSVNTHRVCLIDQLKMYEDDESYNEIVLANNKTTNPIGVFVKKNAPDYY